MASDQTPTEVDIQEVRPFFKKTVRIETPDPKRRTVEESPRFTQDLGNIAPAIITDVVLDPVKDKIAVRAEQFEELITAANIRHAITTSIVVDDIPIPALKVWFALYSDDKVLLIGLTRAGDDEFDDYIIGDTSLGPQKADENRQSEVGGKQNARYRERHRASVQYNYSSEER